MAVVGIIAPFGILLTFGWIGLLIWAAAYSILYLVPSSIALAAAASGLRMLGVWVCQAESKVVERATIRQAIRETPAAALAEDPLGHFGESR